MFPVAVVDAGGLLTAAGLLDGLRYDITEYVALDATALFTAEFLAIVHDGEAEALADDFADVSALIEEWFPVRALAVESALRTPIDDHPEVWASLLLAEALGVPFVTKHHEIRSTVVPVLHC